MLYSLIQINLQYILAIFGHKLSIPGSQSFDSFSLAQCNTLDRSVLSQYLAADLWLIFVNSELKFRQVCTELYYRDRYHVLILIRLFVYKMEIYIHLMIILRQYYVYKLIERYTRLMTEDVSRYRGYDRLTSIYNNDSAQRLRVWRSLKHFDLK